MGGSISQDGKAVAFWSKKLSDTQKIYTTTEKELLAMTEILKEFRNHDYLDIRVWWKPEDKNE